MNSRCTMLHFGMAPHIVASTARRSAFAVLVGFWLTLVIWIPPQNQDLVNHSIEEKKLPFAERNDFRSAQSARVIETLREESSSAPSTEHAEIIRLQRRALPFIEDPPESVEKQPSVSQRLRIEQQRNVQRENKLQRDITDPLVNRKLNDEVRQKRNFLRQKISTTKMLINREALESWKTEHPSVPPNSSGDDENLVSDNIHTQNLFISIKTTKVNHRTRCPPILQTWFQLARNQVRDKEYSCIMHSHMKFTFLKNISTEYPI